MKTLEFVETAGSDRLVRLNIPVDDPDKRYHVIVHVEAEGASESSKTEYLSDEFVRATVGKWIGEFPTDSEGDFEEREPL
jgi:hypothetical protein